VSAYVSRRGVVYHGGAPAEACEEMERQRARCEFGAEMRAARERKGLGLREFARAIGLSHATVSRAEKGDGVLGVASITRVAVALGADVGRWQALAGHLPADLVGALLAAPDRWDDVRALLAAWDAAHVAAIEWTGGLVCAYGACRDPVSDECERHGTHYCAAHGPEHQRCYGCVLVPLSGEP
jgi:transcriptional regulator with XRE-family HTH domain